MKLDIVNSMYCITQECPNLIKCLFTGVSCGTAVVEAATVSSDDMYYTDEVQVFCIDGYEMTGDPIITCQATKEWTTFPNCTSELL